MMTENAVKVLEYLQSIHGKKNVTSADVAEELDMAKRTVDGVFTGLVKKKLGVRVEAEVPGTAEISFLKITETGMNADTTEMSENAQKIIAFLSKNTDDMTLDDLAEAIDLPKRSVCGSFNALEKKGLCARQAVTVEAPVSVKYLTLTAEGSTYVPSDDEATDAE